MTDVNEHSPATHGSTAVELTMTLAGLRVAERALRDEPYDRIPALAGELAIASMQLEAMRERIAKLEEMTIYREVPTCPECGTEYRCRMESRAYKCQCGATFYASLTAYECQTV